MVPTASSHQLVFASVHGTSRCYPCAEPVTACTEVYILHFSPRGHMHYTHSPPPRPAVFLSPLRFYRTPPIGSCPDSAVLLIDRWPSFPQVFPEEKETREVQRERDLSQTSGPGCRLIPDSSRRMASDSSHRRIPDPHCGLICDRGCRLAQAHADP